MTLNGAIMQLVELHEHSMMPVFFKPALANVIDTISELEEPTQTNAEATQDFGKDTNVPSIDCISRQAAIKLAIDLDCESRGVIKESKCREIENRYNMIPSAQPQIVRCKDCAKHEYCRTSTVWAIPPKDDWYCADAERRTDAETKV